MKRFVLLVALVAGLAGGTVAGVAAAAPTATITFSLSTTDGFHPSCTLTVTSSKDISNFTVNGVKTELSSGTTTLVLQVSNGDVITVKAGTTTATYTVTGCLAH
jgi:ABC-type glycerol-3-phosphate transport system substrate-binding protein